MSENKIDGPSKKRAGMDAAIIDLYLEKYPEKWGSAVPHLDAIGRGIRNRKPMYGTREEIYEIVSWKRGPTGAKFYDENSEDDVRKTTEKALAKEKVAEKVEILAELNQVSTAMASAILRFVNPSEFGTVDWRNWYVLSQPTNTHNENNVLFNKGLLKALDNLYSSVEITSNLYMVYLTVIRELATKFPKRTEKGKQLRIIKEIINEYPHRTPAEIDMAIFSYSWEFLPEKDKRGLRG